MKRLYIIFTGKVQGVGFRTFVQLQAIKYHCSGFVKNMENGNVEMEIQGEDSDINHVLSVLKEGNMFIQVHDYAIKEISCIKEDKRFVIHY